jgi:hypothetical protein
MKTIKEFLTEKTEKVYYSWSGHTKAEKSVEKWVKIKKMDATVEGDYEFWPPEGHPDWKPRIDPPKAFFITVSARKQFPNMLYKSISKYMNTKRDYVYNDWMAMLSPETWEKIIKDIGFAKLS